MDALFNLVVVAVVFVGGPMSLLYVGSVVSPAPASSTTVDCYYDGQEQRCFDWSDY